MLLYTRNLTHYLSKPFIRLLQTEKIVKVFFMGRSVKNNKLVMQAYKQSWIYFHHAHCALVIENINTVYKIISIGNDGENHIESGKKQININRVQNEVIKNWVIITHENNLSLSKYIVNDRCEKYLALKIKVL